MSRLTVQVDETGVCRVYVGEHPIGLLEHVILTFSNEALPALQVTFVDTDKLEGITAEDQRSMLARIRQYKLLLARNPFVHIFDKGDTQPSGVPIVPHHEEG
jgi:hypothetical protein